MVYIHGHIHTHIYIYIIVLLCIYIYIQREENIVEKHVSLGASYHNMITHADDILIDSQLFINKS